MKEQDVLSDLKLRLGYGITGQQDVGRITHTWPDIDIVKQEQIISFGDQQYTLLRLRNMIKIKMEKQPPIM